ncbi:MAG: rod shape-determining protein MreC, partial [Bacteroidales bacterium]|nr:rod shape-determining protein MreC [Bacteroidales bacterium]
LTMSESIWIVMIYKNVTYAHYNLAKAAQTITGPFYDMRHSVVQHFDFAFENEKLVQQNILLMREHENNFIDKQDSVVTVYDTSSSKKVRMYDYSYAHVIHNTTHKKYNYIIIDKGFNDGICADMAVLSAQGVVGSVSNVSANFASVLPILHPDSRISAKLMSINQIGTIVWEEGDSRHAYLVDIPQHLSVNIGDSVVTSGFSNVFPKNLFIGTVSEIDNSNSSFLKIQIKLATSFNHLNTVYLVKNFYQSELDTLKSTFKKDE